jgi:hypothetical protein
MYIFKVEYDIMVNFGFLAHSSTQTENVNDSLLEKNKVTEGTE